MDGQTKIGIGAAAGIALMALLEPHLFETHTILAWIIYLLLAGVLIWGFMPVLQGVAIRLRGTMLGIWGPWILIVGGPVIGLLWLSVSIPGPIKSEALGLRGLINWEGLSPRESALLAKSLEHIPPRPLIIVCRSDACSQLAADFAKLFKSLKWDPYIRDVMPPGLFNTVGIVSLSNDDTAEILKNAIEGATSLRVTTPIGTPERSSIGYLGILAKPISEPLPPKALKEVQDLGRQIKDLAVQIMEFAGDRDREETALPTNGTPYDLFDKRAKFSQQTESLTAQKFAARLTPRVAELTGLGIVTPFHVSAGGARNPRYLAKYLSVMGDYLERGLISDARNNAMDQDFWFRQLH